MKGIKKFYAVLSGIFIILTINISFAERVPDTGQSKCYDDHGNEIYPCPEKGESFYGQDANYTINPQSYTKLDSQGKELSDSALQWAMIRDNITGLIWENKTDDGSIHDKTNTYNWEEAQTKLADQLNSEKFGGYSDWRLPNIKELSFIVKRDNYNPSINKDFFQVTVSDIYWSSTEAPYETVSYVRYVHFLDGNIYNYYKTYPYFARCVRGEEGWLSDNLVINNNGTVTNASTSLIWQKNTGGYMNWKDALEYCENLTLAGSSDWRLPNINELQSLADYNKYNPVISEYYFSDTQSEPYWSSTTNAGSAGNAWTLFFNNGGIYYNNKTDNYYVRCVSGGYITVSRKFGSSCYTTGTKLTVSLSVTPSFSTESYAVEDTPPEGWTVSNISNSGTFDSVGKKVKFGPFLDNTSRTLTYNVTPAANATGDKTFTGVASADGISISVLGDSVISVCSDYHPADISPSDFYISIEELTAYGASWKKGDTWSVSPNPIPIDYVTRAGSIWKGGEKYRYDISFGACPICWINSNARSKRIASDSSAVSTMPASFNPGETFTVSIAVTPASDVVNYAVEDIVPSGWAVSDISDSGYFDTINNKVKYGLFFDNQKRTLTYQVKSSAYISDNYTLVGKASFDGVNIEITGDRNISADGGGDAVPGDANQDGKLDLQDVIYILQILTDMRK